MRLSRTVSEINGDFSRKSQIFLPRVFNAPAEVFLLEFCIIGMAQKRVMPLPDGVESDDICIRLNTITQRDRWTIGYFSV